MATAKDWLTWEVKAEIKEDKIINNIIGTLKKLRNKIVEHRLLVQTARWPHETRKYEEVQLEEAELVNKFVTQSHNLILAANQEAQFADALKRTVRALPYA